MAAEKTPGGRSVGRALATLMMLLVVLGVAAFWASLGVYQLSPQGGEAALVQRFGAYRYTEARPGIRWHWPPPIEKHEIVLTGQIEREEFGATVPGEQAEAGSVALNEASMQTRDNNIVNLGFVVQYKVGKAFEARYRLADPHSTLRDAAQAAVREVVGRTTIDEVLSEKRGEVEAEAALLLQQTLDGYDSGLYVLAVQLQEVQPPEAVREAFDDVIAAAQDRNRKVNEAEGYANEVLPQARAEASELIEEAVGYRDSKIAEARGEADRFLAILEEYRKAPDVTRTRLYLETMEEVMPKIETLVIEPGTAAVLPYFHPSGNKAQP